MKKTLFLFLFCGAIFSANSQTFNVQLKDNTRQTYAISNLQKLTFSNGIMNIYTQNGNRIPFSLGAIHYLNFNTLSGLKKPSMQDNEAVRLYPNPVNDWLHITLTSQTAKPIKIEAFSLDGKTVYSNRAPLVSGVASINLASLKKGMYLLTINNGEQTFTKKFVKL